MFQDIVIDVPFVPSLVVQEPVPVEFAPQDNNSFDLDADFLSFPCCHICKYEFNDANPLRRVNRLDHNSCEGCYRLRRMNYDIEDLHIYLKDGYIPTDDIPPFLEGEEYEVRFETKKKNMNLRAKKYGRKIDYISVDVKTLYENGDRCCAVSGSPVFFHEAPPHKIPFWALTLDHITPVSLAPNDPATHRLTNIQVMAHCLNQVKGNSTNDDLLDWYYCYLSSLN